jgi:deazaflavin-dependent oxidoreductase (nitroreductase family)
VVVGSKGGAHRHPAWLLKLQTQPACSAQVGRFLYQCAAEITDGDARERYWDLLARVWPIYNDYQARTERRIPVVLLRTSEPPVVVTNEAD